MFFYKYEFFLKEYENELSKISIESPNYRKLVQYAVEVFFSKIKKKDLEYYFKNFNKENINKNNVQKDALHYLILLTIKETNRADLFRIFFPECLESELTARSSWRVVRWLQMILAWIIKPKPKLNNLAESKTILNALRDIEDRIENNKNNLLNVNLEINSYKSFSFMVEKFLEHQTPLLIYIPIDEEKLFKNWLVSCIQKFEIICYGKEYLAEYSEEYLEIDTLLKYLKNRIKILLDSDEKNKLLNEFIKLQDFVFKKEFYLFEEKILEIKEFTKSKFNYA